MKMDFDSSNEAKYTLRTKSLLKRIESERSRQGSKRKEPKEKPKPPPLSKYRRKTANARERNRMREINEAFETLQKTLPDLPGVDAEKLTKITVLRLAVNYIKILSCVKDGEIIGTKDIDDLRELWCMKNAHMARPEHCVRPVFKPSKLNSNPTKSLKILNSKPKFVKSKVNPSFKPSDANKEKCSTNTKKRPSKSRTRGKICKTASVATSNGAYITLKNVAFQTHPNKRTHIDNKPMMMSMTVKRPRLDHISFKRPPKICRYEPRVSTPKLIKPEIICNENINNMNNICSTIINNNSIINNNNTNNIFNGSNNSNGLSNVNFNAFLTPFNIENISPLLSTLPFSFVPQDSICSYEDKYLSSFTIYDLDSPIVKNDILVEFPKNIRHSSTSSTIFSEESSLPSSPKTPSPPPATPLGEVSLSNSNLSLHTVSPSYESSDSDSMLAPSIELDSLLGSEPFEEELDNLTSSFVDSDDTLNLFLDHTSSNFICSDINSY